MLKKLKEFILHVKIHSRKKQFILVVKNNSNGSEREHKYQYYLTTLIFTFKIIPYRTKQQNNFYIN